MARPPADPVISLPMICRPGPSPRSPAPRRTRAPARPRSAPTAVMSSIKARRRRTFGNLSLRSQHRASHIPHRECVGRQLQSGHQPGRPFHHFRQRCAAEPATTMPSPTPMRSTSPIPRIPSTSWFRSSPTATPGNADSNLGAAISAGGKFVAFATNASNFSQRSRWRRRRYFHRRPEFGPQRHHLANRQFALDPARGRRHRADRTSDRSGITLEDQRIRPATIDPRCSCGFQRRRRHRLEIQPGESRRQRSRRCRMGRISASVSVDHVTDSDGNRIRPRSP